MTWKTTNTPKGDNKLYSDAKGVVPSLDLRFAEGKTLNDYMTGQQLIQFSRPVGANQSPGTYVDSEGVIQMAGNNLLTYSEEFNNSAWFKVNNPSVTVNDTLDPNGDQTADLISRTTNQAVAYQFSPGAGTYVFSVYAKAGSSNLVTLASSVSFKGSAVTFDLSTGVPGSVVSYYNGSEVSIALSSPVMTDAGNGWWRCQVNVAHTVFRAVHVEPGDLTNTAASAYFWGAQLEKSAKISPYLKTTTSTVAAPRFDHDPTTGESLGLLIEESRTNLLTYSERFDQSAWAVGGTVSVVPNSALSPDGLMTADQITLGTANSRIGQFNLITTTGQTGTASVYLKNIDHVGLLTLRTGLSGGTAYNLNLSLTNEWVRYELTTTHNGTQNVEFHIRETDANASGSFLIWGAQLEAGAFPTSYIPTTGTALTRSADVASITGSDFNSWYNQSEGTVFADASAANAAGNQYLFHTYGASANNNRSAYYLNSSNRPSAAWINSGTTQALLQSATPVSGFEGAAFKYVAAYNTNDFVVGYNGGSLISLTSGTPDPTINLARIGSFAGTIYFLNGTIARLTYFPERLPDSSLQAITQ